MIPDKKTILQARIDEVLRRKAVNLESAYTKSLEELVEDLKIYQYELEFQNDELLRIQDELELSQKKFELLFEEAPVGYVVLNADMAVLNCNKTFRAMMSAFGECEKEQDFRKFISPESQDDFHLFCIRLFKDKHSETIELRFSSSMKPEAYVKIIGNYDMQAEEPCIRLTVMDETEQRLAEQSLRNREFELRIISENISDMVVTSDLTGKILYVSPTSVNLLGFTPEEVRQFNLFDFPHPDDKDRIIMAFQDAVVKKSNQTIEFHAKTKSENWKWVETAGNLISNDDGSVEKAVFVVRDASERKIIADELLKTTDLLNRASLMALVGGWEYEPGSDTVRWNEVTYLIHEAEPGEAISLEKGVSYFCEGEHRERLSMLLTQLMNSGGSFDEEFQLITERGNLKWVRAQAQSRFENEKCVLLYGTVQDIDERKKASLLLQQNEKDLRELNATKDRLFSIIAHDLRSPFNGILGLSELMLDEIREKKIHDLEKFALRIVQSSRVAFDLLTNLITWAFAQVGKLGFNPENHKLDDILFELFNIYEENAHQKSIEMSYAGSQNITVYADAEMLKAIMRNLLSNALKFSYKGGKISVKALRTNDEVVIAVSDTGTGISKIELQKILTLHSFESKKGTAGESGSGLGLSICIDFVERHSGKFWAESEPGKGTTFYFSLPLNNNQA